MKIYYLFRFTRYLNRLFKLSKLAITTSLGITTKTKRKFLKKEKKNIIKRNINN